MIWIGDNALSNWAYRLTCRFFIVTFTLRTEVWVNLENTVTHGDCAIWAFRVTHITIDALIGNQQGHIIYPLGYVYLVLSSSYALAVRRTDPYPLVLE